MEWKAAGALAAALVIVPHVAAAEAWRNDVTVLTVKTYDHFGLLKEDLRSAEEEAAAALREVGIELVWLDCWFLEREPDSAPQQCRRPRQKGEIVLRLQSASATPAGKFVAMGFSLIGGVEPPYLSTVFPDVVQSVASGAASDARRVLGLAIAHEIGHLLLNTHQHAHAGLMRADWSRAELRRNDRSYWRFAEPENAVMQGAARQRASGEDSIFSNGPQHPAERD